MDDTEYGSIERELYIHASPALVFEVVSRPEHLREWWPDDATLGPDATGTLIFHGDDPDAPVVVPMQVVESDPPRSFSFWWAHRPGEVPETTSAFLVTFTLEATGAGTTVRMTETGFRERGWEIATLEATYREHAQSWDVFLPRLVRYADRLATVA
jgi:uncharacterized protein YndB with AHSA1/START domain